MTAVKFFVPQTVNVEYRSYFHFLLNSIWKILEFIPDMVKHISVCVQTFVSAKNVIFCLRGASFFILRRLSCTRRVFRMKNSKLY
jgi:hypothetical protein